MMNQMILIALGVSLSAGPVVANPGLVRMHENMDVNQDGVVTEAEFMDSWDHFFNRMDANKDQLLNRSETSAEVLKQADKDKDGRVTLSEHQQLRQTHFGNMDKDGSRTLTLAEMAGTAAGGKQAVNKLIEPDAGLVAANLHLVNLHKSMDVNLDGVVSRTEFLAYWANIFNQRDKNKDHQLSALETGAAMMKKVDSDQNGVLTWEEEQVLRLEHWKTMDKNEDQNLTLLEILEAPAAKPAAAGSTPAMDDFSAQRARVAALSRLTTAPAMHQAEGFDSTDNLVIMQHWIGRGSRPRCLHGSGCQTNTKAQCPPWYWCMAAVARHLKIGYRSGLRVAMRRSVLRSKGKWTGKSGKHGSSTRGRDPSAVGFIMTRRNLWRISGCIMQWLIRYWRTR
jgi:Ca2+-binding EF-hand superfamily protein